MPLKAIYNALSTSTALASRVTDKIYPVAGGQDRSFPSVTYKVNDGEVTKQKDITPTVDSVIVQINIFAPTFSQVMDIYEVIRTLLHGYVGAGTYADVRMIVLERYHDNFEEEVEMYHRAMIFNCRKII